MIDQFETDTLDGINFDLAERAIVDAALVLNAVNGLIEANQQRKEFRRLEDVPGARQLLDASATAAHCLRINLQHANVAAAKAVA